MKLTENQRRNLISVLDRAAMTISCTAEMWLWRNIKGVWTADEQHAREIFERETALSEELDKLANELRTSK